MSVRTLATALVASLVLAGCGEKAAGPAPTPSPSVRSLRVGAAQIAAADPTGAARVWQFATIATRPEGVVVIGVDDVALRASTHEAVPGTLSLVREAVAWGRTVLYLTTNPYPTHVQTYLDAAGYPAGRLWTPKTAPWCGWTRDSANFRAACVRHLASHRDVILWLTRGQQHRTPADRTYAFN